MNKKLTNEIKTFLEFISKKYGPDSLEYKQIEYYMDILESYYSNPQYSYDASDIYIDCVRFISSLSSTDKELSLTTLKNDFKNINRMMHYYEKMKDFPI